MGILLVVGLLSQDPEHWGETGSALHSLLVGSPLPEGPDNWAVILRLFPKKTVD